MLRTAVIICLVAVLWPSSQGSPLQDDHFEGDIVLTRGTRNTKLSRKWPNRRIPYILDSKFDSDANKKIKNTVIEAIREFNEKTCLKWVPRTSETQYAHIKRPNSGVCSSPLGIGGRAGVNAINLGINCGRMQTVLHEMMHTMGFDHEQNRPDRDQYVNILWDNIKSGFARYFNKNEGSSTLNLPYDYTSVMHYEADAWSKDGKLNTIVPKDGNVSKIKTNYGHLSTLDVKKINALYGCPNFKGNWKPQCVDTHGKCAELVKLGDCTADWSRERLKRWCRKSCGYC